MWTVRRQRLANRDPDVPRVVVSGFAALDHAMGVGELPGPNRGTLVTRRLSEPFPRQGGSAPGRSAAAWLFYDPLGRSLFFLDPGGAESTELNPAQRLALSRAGWLCITAGPPLVSERVLDASAAAIAWCVKADPVVFPPPLSRRLLRTAALIVHNRSEEDFLQDAASPDPLDELVSPESLIIATTELAAFDSRTGTSWGLSTCRQSVRSMSRVPATRSWLEC